MKTNIIYIHAIGMAQPMNANDVIHLVVDDDESDNCNDSDSDFDGYLDDDEMEELIRRKDCIHGGDFDEDVDEEIDNDTEHAQCSDDMQMDIEQEMDDTNAMNMDYYVMDYGNELYGDEQYEDEQDDDEQYENEHDEHEQDLVVVHGNKQGQADSFFRT